MKRRVWTSAVVAGLALWSASGRVEAGTYTVTSSAVAGPGTLAEAIALANSTPELDFIEFAIPGHAPIVVSQPLSITRPVVINGDGVQEVSSSDLSAPVFELLPGSDGSVIRRIADSG